MLLKIALDGDKLYATMPGQNKIELLPETPSKFLSKMAPVEAEFIKDESGKVTKLIIYESGKHEAQKIE